MGFQPVELLYDGLLARRASRLKSSPLPDGLKAHRTILMSLTSQIAESVALIRARWSGAPKVGIILGSGLGSLADEIDERVAIPYAEIPHFPQSTAIGHAGRLFAASSAGHESSPCKAASTSTKATRRSGPRSRSV